MKIIILKVVTSITIVILQLIMITDYNNDKYYVW